MRRYFGLGVKFSLILIWRREWIFLGVENGSLNAMSGRGNVVSFFEKKSVELMVAVMTLQQQWGEYEDMQPRQEVRLDEVRLPVR